MATLLLTAVGTLVGGPIGGAIGALAGRSIDGAILGGPKREGPRLKELTLSTSSYGQPLPRQHGRMRAGGTIIWATDLVEHRSTSGGKKGQPSTTTYSYTSSFAVALSSRPILGVGRIWADGNLLRGEAGDLKVAGALRVHRGHGDQMPDPLIAAAEGAACPAFRGCAYAVFEDLALADFGNRIPALSFEIFADEGAIALADLVDPLGLDAATGADLGPLAGFANEGGPLAATLDTIDTLFPLAIDAGGDRLTIEAAAPAAASPPLLPEPVRAGDEADYGAGEGRREGRDAGTPSRVEALRYYDVARDYQPGVQRSGGRTMPGAQRTIEFPGAFVAEDARALAEAAARRDRRQRETMRWRIAELDPAHTPGADVRVPGAAGIWRIEQVEWRECGVELELLRRPPAAAARPPTDPGVHLPPVDTIAGATILRAFELPPSGTASGEPTLFAAVTGEGAFSGAALYVERAGELVPIGTSGRRRATIGALAAPLAPSAAILFEPGATLEVDLDGSGGSFDSMTLAALASGANRLLVGEEVLQFALAEQTGAARWRLTGLLRGRGGSEPAARAGHSVGAQVVLIDDALIDLDPALVSPQPGTVLAAIGLGDGDPVFASLGNAGAGRRPPCPVHPRAAPTGGGGLMLGWTRRARGAWTWDDGVDAPLVEEAERYRVGYGSFEEPAAEWLTGVPSLVLDAATLAALAGAEPGGALWVRQVGSYAQSDPLLLTHVA